MQRRHLLPTGILTLGLAGTLMGLMQQTHQQALINHETNAVVANLGETHTVTASVTKRLLALHTMDQGLVAINQQIALANTHLVGQAQAMATILATQQKIWGTLGQLNQGLAASSTALTQNRLAVGVTISRLQSPNGIVPETMAMSTLIQDLNQSSVTTTEILDQMNHKLSLLGSINQALP